LVEGAKVATLASVVLRLAVPVAIIAGLNLTDVAALRAQGIARSDVGSHGA